MAGKFVSQVVTLAGGTALAQIVNLATLPVLTRLYSPADFGILAVFLAIATMGAVLVTLKYENAIMAAQTDGEARHCVALVLWLSSVVAAAMALLGWLVYLVKSALPEEFLIVVVCSTAMMAVTAWVQALYFYGNRVEQYGYLTRGRVFGALTTGIFAILYGFYSGSYEGLLIGTVLGSLVNVGYLWIRGKQFDFAYLRDSRRFLGEVAKQNARFPKFLVLSSLLERASAQFHILVLTNWFSPAAAGSVALHNRVVSLPSTLVGNAIGDVFRQKASEALRTAGNCQHLFSGPRPVSGCRSSAILSVGLLRSRTLHARFWATMDHGR